MKYELKNKTTGTVLVADCKFVDGEFETTDPEKQATLDNVGHVKRIKTKKKKTTTGGD